MRRLAFTLVLLLVLAVPLAATADVPPAAVAACQAEYAQLGADAFVAKYGPAEPWGHCYAAHTPTTPTTTTATDSPAAAACKAEYLKLGADAFAAKYGGSEALGRCVRLHGQPQPATTDPATSVAGAFCVALAKSLGNCVKAALASAKALVASCRTSSGTSKDAFRACLAAGLQPRRS